MARTTKIADFSTELMGILNDYEAEVEAAAEKAVDKTGKKTAKYLRSVISIPADAEKYGLWDDYIKTWTSSKRKNTKYLHNRSVHNKRKYMMVHLLEKGHEGPIHAKAYPHVEIAEKKGIKMLEDEMIKEVEKI